MQGITSYAKMFSAVVQKDFDSKQAAQMRDSFKVAQMRDSLGIINTKQVVE